MNATLASRKVFAYLAFLELISAVPLAVFLPFSVVTLSLTTGILFILNASALAAIQNRFWLTSLEAVNLAVCSICLALAVGQYSLIKTVVGVALLCSFLFAVGIFRLPDRTLKQWFSSQQVALASTLIFWVVIRPLGADPILTDLISADHFRAGLRFLFAGPLVLVGITFVAGIKGWKGYLVALAGVCAGQYSVGLFELGAALESFSLIVAGFVFGAIFIFLIVLSIVPRRSPTIRSAC